VKHLKLNWAQMDKETDLERSNLFHPYRTLLPDSTWPADQAHPGSYGKTRLG
jgi:hypothetical protein